eukprot:177666_1
MASGLIKTLIVLNVDKQLSTIKPEQISSKKPVSAKTFIISDADEELLILIEFKDIIQLHSLKIFALPNDSIEELADSSPPKDIHVYKLKHINVNFEDIKSLKPDKSIVCSSKKLNKGQKANLKKQSLKFSKTKYLAVYISSNQNDSETTYINAIQFKTENDQDYQQKQYIMDDTKDYAFENTDNENKNKLVQISKHFTELQITSVNTYEHLLGKHILQTAIPICEFQQCSAVNNIVKSLQQYHKYIQHKTDEDLDAKESMTIDQVYETGYETHDLLNDYHHMLQYHDTDFENICKFVNYDDQNNELCDLSNCVMMRRNRRNRHLMKDKLNTLNKLYFNDDIVKQQLIDKIHVYFSHTFDLGYRLTNNYKQLLCDKNEQMSFDKNEQMSFDKNEQMSFDKNEQMSFDKNEQMS